MPERDVPRYINLYKQGKLLVQKTRAAAVQMEDINVGFDRLLDGDEVRQMLKFAD